MPKVKNLERATANVEGFEVTIRHADGRDMRGDKQGLPGYECEKGAKNDFTVAQWREQRFQLGYPGYGVTVWLADGAAAHGSMKLSTMRDSYLED
jgi:hypothetical protein